MRSNALLFFLNPVPRNAKMTAEDDILPDGTIVRKGDIIGFSTWCMGRNKSVWGIDAEQFVPERWLVDNDDVSVENDKHTQGVSPFGKFRAENQHKFNSFNSGPRLCLVRSKLVAIKTWTCAATTSY